jgi:hypothetical protein
LIASIEPEGRDCIKLARHANRRNADRDRRRHRGKPRHTRQDCDRSSLQVARPKTSTVAQSVLNHKKGGLCNSRLRQRLLCRRCALRSRKEYAPKLSQKGREHFARSSTSRRNRGSLS